MGPRWIRRIRPQRRTRTCATSAALQPLICWCAWVATRPVTAAKRVKKPLGGLPLGFVVVSLPVVLNASLSDLNRSFMHWSFVH